MSTPITSLVAVSKDTCLRAAEAALADVKVARAAEREKTILKVLAAERRWAGWFKRRPVTLTEAESMVDTTQHSLERWWMNRWQHDRKANETLAKQLKTAAALSQDGCVWLNLENAYYVADWSTGTKVATVEERLS